MMSISKNLADQTHTVVINGETESLKIVPQFSSSLRKNLVFWQLEKTDDEGSRQNLINGFIKRILVSNKTLQLKLEMSQKEVEGKEQKNRQLTGELDEKDRRNKELASHIEMIEKELAAKKQKCKELVNERTHLFAQFASIGFTYNPVGNQTQRKMSENAYLPPHKKTSKSSSNKSWSEN